MAISDLLNRRVRARADDDEGVYSDGSESEVHSDAEGSDESGSDNSSEISEGGDDEVWTFIP